MMYSQIYKQQTNIKLSFNQSNSNKAETESKESDHVKHKEHHSSDILCIVVQEHSPPVIPINKTRTIIEIP